MVKRMLDLVLTICRAVEDEAETLDCCFLYRSMFFYAFVDCSS